MAVRRAPIRTCADVRRLFAHLAEQPRELIAAAYLDADWRLLALRHSPSASADAATLPLRQIARDAVLLDAARVVIAHNHPSGDPAPSAADKRATRRLARALGALGSPLVEHLVVARGGRSVSLAAAGLL
jgi:DNA repair protein RadC